MHAGSGLIIMARQLLGDRSTVLLTSDAPAWLSL